ncbi:DNA recombination/repair protein RecA [Microlunatus elymi]|uniref:DNA recombination/repair protein RecA n=1 Tax=Microlunatus elymi TaxID=2596828 RepID=A0A516PZ68_9ACTN|nr:DNA recombination/repair protein RecA [Microlunatus elymi]QDP96458.1 DNA recombination/repair protein RecA [Microlunatus elymi]
MTAEPVGRIFGGPSTLGGGRASRMFHAVRLWLGRALS